jgi:hypothetical protein
VPYLVGEITPLQAQICADVLVDGPRKLVVQLPCFKGKEDRSERHQAGQGNEHGLYVDPELFVDESLLVQRVCGIFDLVKLDGSVDENAHVVDDESDDLNGVLQPQGVPHEPQLVKVAEHEDGQVGGDGAGFAVPGIGLPVDVALEFAKDIAARDVSRALRRIARRRDDVRFQDKSDGGLADGRQHKGPCPGAVRKIHPGCAANGRRQSGGEALTVVVTSRLRAVGLRWLRHLGRIGSVVVGSVVAVEGLSSQKGCARLVVRNFGRVAAAMGGWRVDIESGRGGGGFTRLRRAQAASSVLGGRRQGWTPAETDMRQAGGLGGQFQLSTKETPEPDDWIGEEGVCRGALALLKLDERLACGEAGAAQCSAVQCSAEAWRQNGRRA